MSTAISSNKKADRSWSDRYPINCLTSNSTNSTGKNIDNTLFIRESTSEQNLPVENFAKPMNSDQHHYDLLGE
jgi:hypothetical protein